ncbi:MAG: hypothetical protein QJR09_08180 [Micrococcus sp.]|nr:hypothetical protein [Micrococcus sp.]
MSTNTIDLAREGFRRAPTHAERVHEAAQLFARGRSGASILSQAVLLEAFTTDDFPGLLGDAFQRQAIAAYKDTPFEFDGILTDVTVDDFKRRKLVDLWGADAFEPVGQGEEYKGASLSETEVEHGTGKYGKAYGLTWELLRARDFSGLANFPRALGNGAVKGQNNAVADLLVADGGWNPEFFGTVETAPLNETNLDAAIRALSTRENHRGELVPTDQLVLVHGPALRAQVNRLLKATELEWKDTSGSRTTTTKTPNPFANVVTPLESRTVGARLGTNGGTGWALVQGNGSDLPSIVRTLLSGHPDVDIRVKRDQGQSVAGGDIPVDQGSFKDDTIWYRGRAVHGIDPAFTTGVYASNGA